MNRTLAYYVTALRRDFTSYCNEKLQELGLSQGQLFFILYVGRHPGCSPKELAQALQMDTGHVTRSLVKLEQGDFLFQECDSKDRRAHILWLKEKGEEAFRISHELFTSWDETVMRNLSEEDRQQIFPLLESLVCAANGDMTGGEVEIESTKKL